MATSQQPGYAECIEAFHKYIKAKQVCGSNSSSSEAKFIQFYALQDYFDANRMGKIFKLLSQPNLGNEIRQKNYLRVFSILVFIGKAEYITQFIRYPSLDDGHLPFLSPTHPPHNWPPPIEEFYPEFYSAQWQFCPQKFVRENLWNVCFEEDHILPIVEKMQMRKGRNAVIYKIKVLENHNTLIHLDSNGWSRPKTFALKTYFTKDAEKYYQNEVEAFNQMMLPVKHEPHIISLFGAYRHGRTYNILLEHADGGNLMDYFESITPPSSEEDVLRFWSSLLKVVEPIKRIHELEGSHQNIKPSNILVTSGATSSEYDRNFKLADLGMSHFASKTGDKRNLKRKEAFGNPMYSAPECCMGGVSTETLTYDFEPLIDIWSLGCIFSEAIVWTLLGVSGVREYRELRRAETGRIANFNSTEYSGCFHDGTKILPAVSKMHKKVKNRRLDEDHITEHIVILIEGMLGNIKSRFNILQVESYSRSILMNAREQEYPKVFRIFSSPVLAPRTPLQQTPEPYESLQETTPESGTSPNGTTPPSSLGSGRDFVDSFHSNESRGKIDDPFAELDVFLKTGIPPKDNNGPPLGRYPPDRYAPSPPRPPHRPPPTPPYRSPYTPSSATSTGQTPVHNPYQKKEPVLSVEEVLEWKNRVKLGSGTMHLTGKEYLNRLGNRDHVFLIDDSKSMGPYWSNVTKTFSALSYLVKHVDPDGIDLHFTNSLESHHSRRTHHLLEKVQRRKPAGQCDMKSRLGKILEPYRAELPKALESSRHRHFLGIDLRQWSSKGRSICIYVFTDGVWQGGLRPLGGVDEPIGIFVDKLKELGLLDTQVGIQFIRFGNDKRGMERLQKLDSDLHLPMDIVDTTPWNGNVWKMLLGAIDRDWDDEE